MTEAYLGQIQTFGFSFAPAKWALCQGQILSIQQNTALFSLLGVNYGGNGTSNFGLPDLRGIATVGAGNGPGLSPYLVGETGGATTVALTNDTLPRHQHTLVAENSPATTTVSLGNQLGGKGKGTPSTLANIYSNDPSKATTGLAPVAILPAGQNVAHNNMQPYLTVNFSICVAGNFPPRP